MGSSIHHLVRRTIRRHLLCPSGSRVLVAVSGGSDSVALTFLLCDLAEQERFAPVALAHLNHRLRPSAGRDEAFCRDLATRVGLPIVVETVDVAAYAVAARLSVEEAARRARYAFLHRAAADAHAERIAVGHTRDDQAETFLLKLARGAGLSGLGGIYPRKGALIRPLLDASREGLREYLTARGESWMEDESNGDLGNPRNRIRHRVLPELDTAYGGQTRGAIARAAALAREDGVWLDEVATAAFDRLVVADAGARTFDAGQLAAEPLPVRRRVLLRAMRELGGAREISWEHVEAALEVLAGGCGGVDVPGSRVELRRGKLVLQVVGRGSAPK